MEIFYFRLLNKQIKDKSEHRDRLAADLKKDEERKAFLETEIDVSTQ